jgi:hypothetical protein
MDDSYRNLEYYLVKGFINGHGKNALPIHAAFLGLSDGRSERFLRTRFSRDPIEKDTPWSDLVTLLNAGEPTEDDGQENSDPLQGYAERLNLFIHSERVLLTEKKALDAKAIERFVTHFCAYDLEINAITFVDVTKVSEEDVASLLKELREKAPGEAQGAGGPEDESGGTDQATDSADLNEIFLECGMVIDPVAGLPASKLSVGQEIYCRLPEDSPFYKICESNMQDFNGIVIGSVTGIKTNEFGNSVVAVALSEGISGVMKVQGNIWVKVGSHGTKARNSAQGELPHYMMLGTIGAALLLLAIGILFRYLN